MATCTGRAIILHENEPGVLWGRPPGPFLWIENGELTGDGCIELLFNKPGHRFELLLSRPAR